MIHGDRSQSQRNKALSGFQEGRFQYWWRLTSLHAVFMWTMWPT